MDRNPSPPPLSGDEDKEEAAGGDCIGSTVYSKHWLFGVLSRLIQVRKFAPLMGSSYVPLDSRPASGGPLQPWEPRSPRRPLPRPQRLGLTPCVLAVSADPKAAGIHSLLRPTQKEL